MTNLQFFISHTLNVVASSSKCSVYCYSTGSSSDNGHFCLRVDTSERSVYEFYIYVGARRIIVNRHNYYSPSDFRFYPDELQRICPFLFFSYTNYEKFIKSLEFALDILSDYNSDLFN